MCNLSLKPVDENLECPQNPAIQVNKERACLEEPKDTTRYVPKQFCKRCDAQDCQVPSPGLLT
jgi:ArsR family metal-binding transcriptional regulator